MILSGSIQSYYDEQLPRLMLVRERVAESAKPFCRSKSFLFDDRIKSLSSLAEKLESGRWRSAAQLDDLYGCVVVVATPSEHDEAVGWLESQFEIIRSKRRATGQKSPDVFRFDGTRLYANLRHPDELSDIVFEIQVATMFEYAWARTTHSLAYKSSSASWKQARATAMLRALAEQADLVVATFESLSDSLEKSSWPAIDDRNKIIAFFAAKVDAGQIPKELTPASWARFGENVYRIIRSLTGSKNPLHDSSKPLREMDDALALVDKYLKRYSGPMFPMSLSLLQSVLGVLSEDSGFQEFRAKNYFLPISKELLDIFPHVSALGWEEISSIEA